MPAISVSSPLTRPPVQLSAKTTFLVLRASSRATRRAAALDDLASRAILREPAGVGQRECHQILGLEMTEAAADRRAFAESRVPIGPAAIADQERRHRMPTVAL